MPFSNNSKTAAGRSCKQHVSLECLPGIGIPGVPASMAETWKSQEERSGLYARCFSTSQHVLHCGLDSVSYVDGMCSCATICSSFLPLPLTHKYCCT
jgi:hypothetical protein